MPQLVNRQLKESSPYTAVMTREQFLFHETRTTAKLMETGLEKEEIVNKIILDNLFQYPTEKSVRQMALACIRRLEALEDRDLISSIANEPSDVAKQICLYAMMRQYRLVWDFMLTVIGEKYRNLDSSFSKEDLNISTVIKLQPRTPECMSLFLMPCAMRWPLSLPRFCAGKPRAKWK